MADELKIKVTTEGAGEATQQITALSDAFKRLNHEGINPSIALIQQQSRVVQETQVHHKSLIGTLQELRENFRQGKESAGGFGQSLRMILTSGPVMAWAALAVAVGSVVKVLLDGADAALHAFQNIDHLRQMTGLTATEVQQYTNAMKLAGVSTQTFGYAITVLGMHIAQNAPALQHLGITAREPAEAFKQVMTAARGVSSDLEKLTILSELFGMRIGRTLLPAVKMTNEAFDRYMERGKENIALTESEMNVVNSHREALEQLTQQHEKLRIQAGLVAGIKLQEWYMDMITFLHQAAAGWGVVADRISKAADQLVRFFRGGPKEEPGEVLTQEEYDRLHPPEAGAARAAVRPVTPQDVAIASERIRFEMGMKGQLIAGEASLEAARLSMLTGTADAGIAIKRQALVDELDLARERDRRLRAEEQKLLAVGGTVGIKAEQRRQEDMAKAEQKFHLQSQQLQMESDQGALRSERETMTDRISARRTAFGIMLADQKELTSAELADLAVSHETGTKKAAEGYRIRTEAATSAAAATKSLIAAEIEDIRKYAAAHAQNTEIQREALNKTQALNAERVAAERAANAEIINARREMYQKLRDEAEKERALGGGLVSQAVADLKTKGYGTITPDLIRAQVQARVIEAQTTAGQFGRGGGVSPEQFARMQETGALVQQGAMGGFGLGPAMDAWMKNVTGAPFGKRPDEIPAGMQIEQDALFRELLKGGATPVNALKAIKDRMEAIGLGAGMPGAEGAGGPYNAVTAARDSAKAFADTLKSELGRPDGSVVRAVIDGVIRNLELDAARQL